jgi:hypothetical protein
MSDFVSVVSSSTRIPTPYETLSFWWRLSVAFPDTLYATFSIGIWESIVEPMQPTRGCPDIYMSGRWAASAAIAADFIDKAFNRSKNHARWLRTP